MHKLQRSVAAAIGAFALAAVWVPAAKADAPSYFEPPRFKIQIKPNYPESARIHRETGTVFVKVLVAADGSAKSITIAKSSGHKDLDAEVMRVAKLSSYLPAQRDGKPTLAFYDFSYAFTLSGLSENTAAEGDLGKRLSSDPRNVPARMSLIDLALNKNDYTQAEKLGDEGVQLVPSDGRLWAERGRAYYNDGVDNKSTSKLKIAADSYDRAMSLGGVPAKSAAAEAYAQYAFNLMANQQFSQCLPYAQKASNIDPNAAQYRMLKGDCEAGLDPKSQAALADYQAAQRLDDKKNPTVTSRLLASLGNLQLNMGDTADGLNSIVKAERIDPKAPYAYQYLATYYISSGNLNAALNPLLQLAQVQPNNAQAQINIGDIYVRQKNFTAAQAAYQKALSISPNDADAAFGLAEIPAAQGDTKSIDAPLQKAISMAPSNAAIYNASVAQLLLNATSDKADHSTDAQRYADAATKGDPNYPMGWYSLGISYADQNKKDQANSALRKAFDLFKAKNDQNGMQFVDKAWQQLNGKNSSLMNGGSQNSSGT